MRLVNPVVLCNRYDTFIEVEALCALRWLATKAGSKYVKKNKESIRSMVIASADLVMEVMHKFYWHEEIQAEALHVLAQLRSCDVRLGKATQRRADHLAILALNKHPSHVGVQAFGLALLSKMSVYPRYSDDLMNVAPCAAAMAALRRHPKNTGVQTNALLVLIHLAAGAQHLNHLAQEGILLSTMEVLRLYPKDSDVQSRGVLLLGYLSFHEQLIDRLANLGAIEVVVRALQMFSNDSEIQANGLLVLLNLVSSGLHVERMVNSRVVEVSTAAVQRHPQHAAVESCGLCLLGILADHLVNKQQVDILIACRPSVAAVLQAHPTDTNLQASGAHLSRKLELNCNTLSTALQASSHKFENMRVR